MPVATVNTTRKWYVVAGVRFVALNETVVCAVVAGICPMGLTLPYAIVVPYWNCQVVARPPVTIVALNVAEVAVTKCSRASVWGPPYVRAARRG